MFEKMPNLRDSNQLPGGEYTRVNLLSMNTLSLDMFCSLAYVHPTKLNHAAKNRILSACPNAVLHTVKSKDCCTVNRLLSLLSAPTPLVVCNEN
jgi:hypothetical protein